MSQRNVTLLLKLAIIAGAFAFLISSQKLHLSQLRLAAEGWQWASIAALFILMQMLLTQVRLWMLLRAAHVDVSLGRVARIGLISWFLNASLLGGLGFLSSDGIRVAYLMRYHEGQYSTIIVAALVDRLVGLAELVTLASGSLLLGLRASLQTEGLGMIPILFYFALTFAGAVAVLLIVSRSLGRGAAILLTIVTSIGAAVVVQADVIDTGLPTSLLVSLTLAAAIPSLVDASTAVGLVRKIPRIGGSIVRALAAIAAYRKCPGSLLLGYASALVSHGFSVLALFSLAHGITINAVPTLGQTLFAAPVALLTSIVPLPANGLGVGEIAFDSMLRLLQTPGADVVTGGAALYLSYRLLSTIAGLVGLPFFLASRRARKHPGTA